MSTKLKNIIAIWMAALMGIISVALFKFVSAAAGTVAGGVCLLVAGIFIFFYNGFNIINKYYKVIVPAINVFAAIVAVVAGKITGKYLLAALAAFAAIFLMAGVLVIKKAKLQVFATIVAIVALVAMVFPGVATAEKAEEKQPDAEVTTVDIDQYNALLSKLDELTDEKEGVDADLAEALAANEELRKLYTGHMAQCEGCPICSGEMTIEELESLKSGVGTGESSNAAGGNGTATGSGSGTRAGSLSISGNALGDGAGNGAGTGGKGSVKPVYDTNVPKPGSKEPVKEISPEKDVDLTDDGNNGNIKVEDEHGNTKPSEDGDKPVVEEPSKEETVRLTYSIDGNIVTVTAPEGFKAVEEPLYYIVGSDNVKVLSATAEKNILKIEYEASDDAKLTICKGMFKKGEEKSEELQIEVKKIETPAEEEKPSEEQPGTEEPSDEEMVVTEINIETICDNGFEGDSLQYTVNAEGQNIDYGRFEVTMGTVSSDGTWTITAPAESGSATISFGEVSETVKFTVNKIGSDGTEEETKPAEEETEENPSEEPETPADEGTEKPSDEEKAEGRLTGITLYDSTVICGSDIQGEISFEGEVDWSKVTVSGLNGLSYEISNDGTITIHTDEKASNYVITVSYNGSSVTAEFAVEGVSDPDIVW